MNYDSDDNDDKLWWWCYFVRIFTATWTVFNVDADNEDNKDNNWLMTNAFYIIILNSNLTIKNLILNHFEKMERLFKP